MARGIAASFLGMLVMACGACGGGGGSTSNSVPVAKASNPVLIEEYGDSTTQGFQVINGVGSFTANNEPAELQIDLRAQLGSTVTVGNQGVTATEASQLLNGTDGVHPTWINQMAASKANIVTLNFSLNDAYYTVVHVDGIEPETPATYGDVLTQLVRIAKAAGKQVVLVEPNPVCEPRREPLLGSYVQMLNVVGQAEGAQVVTQYQYIMSLPNWQSLITDCLHPTDALYKIKADREEAVLTPLVQALQ